MKRKEHRSERRDIPPLVGEDWASTRHRDPPEKWIYL